MTPEGRNAQAEKDLAEVLKTAAGRRFVAWVIFDQAKVNNGTFASTNETFFREGRRTIGVELLAVIQNKLPEQYLNMVQERTKALVLKKEKDRTHGQDFF